MAADGSIIRTCVVEKYVFGEFTYLAVKDANGRRIRLRLYFNSLNTSNRRLGIFPAPQESVPRISGIQNPLNSILNRPFDQPDSQRRDKPTHQMRR